MVSDGTLFETHPDPHLVTYNLMRVFAQWRIFSDVNIAVRETSDGCVSKRVPSDTKKISPFFCLLVKGHFLELLFTSDVGIMKL